MYVEQLLCNSSFPRSSADSVGCDQLHQGHRSDNMYHLKISIPSYRQVFSVTQKSAPSGDNNGSLARSHYVYHIEVGFLGEYGSSREADQDQGLHQPRVARFYRLEKRYSSFLALHNELRKRYRLPCEFPPKRVRNTSAKVLETRRLALEKYLQAFVLQRQQSQAPLPQLLLDFLQISTHVPKISNDRVGSTSDSSLSNYLDSTHRSVVGFVSKEPFLFESLHNQQVSSTGLPDIVTQATLQYFYV